MADAELNLEELTLPELLATAAGVASALTGNASFPQPQPSPETLAQLGDELAQAEKSYREQRTRANAAKAACDEAAERLRAALREEVAYVQEASGGSIAKILSANLHVEETTRFWPFNKVGDIEEFSASVGDLPGEIDLAWDPVPGASGYEVEIAYDLLGEGPWEQGGATTHSKMTIERLDNRTRYWFRVRAVSEKGAGDWSEPTMRYAR